MASDPMQQLANNPEISSNGVTKMKQFQGQIWTFEKGAQIYLDLYVLSLLMWASWDIAIYSYSVQSMPTLGGLGACPTGILKNHIV